MYILYTVPYSRKPSQVKLKYRISRRKKFVDCLSECGLGPTIYVKNSQKKLSQKVAMVENVTKVSPATVSSCIYSTWICNIDGVSFVVCVHCCHSDDLLSEPCTVQIWVADQVSVCDTHVHTHTHTHTHTNTRTHTHTSS